MTLKPFKNLQTKGLKATIQAAAEGLTCRPQVEWIQPINNQLNLVAAFCSSVLANGPQSVWLTIKTDIYEIIITVKRQQKEKRAIILNDSPPISALLNF